MTLQELLAALAEAPGIEGFTGVYPRLSQEHPAYLGDSRIDPVELAALLTAAGRDGPSQQPSAVYEECGELPALRTVASPDVVERVQVEWQRKVDARLEMLASRASLCDREGVPCSDLTWAKRIRQVSSDVGAVWSENPAAQALALDAFQNEMDHALRESQRDHLDRASSLRAEIDSRREFLDEEQSRQASQWLDEACRRISEDDFFGGVRTMQRVKDLLSGQVAHTPNQAARRLAPPRRNPFGRIAFRMETLHDTARRDQAGVRQRELKDFPPDTVAEIAARTASSRARPSAASRTGPRTSRRCVTGWACS